MKNIKYVIIGVIISFILFFFVSVLFSFINRNKTIHINEYKGAEDALNILNDKIDKLKKDETCKISLKYMSNRIKDNILTGDVKLKDYYETYYKDDMTFVDYYNYVITACSLETNDITYYKAVGTLVYPNYIKDQYNRSYEIHFVDPLFDDKNIDEIGTYSTLFNEISVLSDVIKELS